uniref:BZIP protein 3 n=1 Tax=Lonicera japonica TaxID=105884 RepID=A0A4Y1JSF1_LONJA|nr:bZIP protein 3 [Lonicera japonica]
MSGWHVGDDDIMDQIDLEYLFDSSPEDLNVELDPSLPSDTLHKPSLNESSNPSPDSVSLTIDEIEQWLMKDDGNGSYTADLNLPYHDFPNDFLLDVLLDSPVDCNGSGEVLDDAVRDKAKDDNNDDRGAEDIDDPISKKRRRQLRNRDAAVRSRERKKTYVRDLELKSKYFEGECKRLGMLLQFYLAENQALRHSLQNSKKAFDASMTKQESAVLLMESLLLGSLLWFLGIVMRLLVLPLALEAAPLEIVGNKKRGLKGAPSNSFFAVLESRSFMMVMGKRCKASRSKMKLIPFPYSISFGVASLCFVPF